LRDHQKPAAADGVADGLCVRCVLTHDRCSFDWIPFASSERDHMPRPGQ
jgi:hypothetical protein